MTTWRDHGGMELDRRPGMFFDVTLQAAFQRAQASGDQAQALLDAGFPEPAYVWAFRSVEIFVKEVMLLLLFLEEVPEGDDFDEVWAEARRRTEDTFNSGRWDNALKKVDEVYGPLEPMVTDDGRDVWQVWKSVALPRRGDIVHGRPVAEVTADEAALLLLWSSQMRGQLSMRLVVAGKHPVHHVVVAGFERRRRSSGRSPILPVRGTWATHQGAYLDPPDGCAQRNAPSNASGQSTYNND